MPRFYPEDYTIYCKNSQNVACGVMIQANFIAYHVNIFLNRCMVSSYITLFMDNFSIWHVESISIYIAIHVTTKQFTIPPLAIMTYEPSLYDVISGCQIWSTFQILFCSFSICCDVKAINN